MTKRKTKSRRRVHPATVILGILILAIIVAAALFLLQKPVVILTDHTRFPVGEKVSLTSLVKEVKYGQLLNEEETFESVKASTRVVTFRIKTRLGKVVEETLTLEFYDNVPPVIAGGKDLSLTVGETLDLLEGITATDNSGERLAVSVQGEYDLKKAGEYKLSYFTADSAGNTATFPFTLTVMATPFDENGKMVDGVYKTSKGFELVIEDGIAKVDGYLIANKSYSLPKDYNTTRSVDENTMTAFRAMQQAAAKAGHTVTIKSASRNWNDQNYIFNGYVARDGLQEALTYSARPGHSEHQSGLAIDVLTSDSEEAKEPKFASALAWLSEHAHEYGFILRYPEGKTDETGYIYESWHFRYVGKELAEKLYNNGDWITMEDYFGIDSKYRGYDE